MVLWLLFLFFFAIIAADLPYKSPRVTRGVWAIFAYPKLYGGIGLWGLFMLAFYRSKLKVN
jgi:hypothetical protein